MAKPLAAAISGSPRAPSKSKTLAELTLEALARGGCRTKLIDLASLPADALLGRSSHSDVDAAIEAIGEARIVVAATPTYRALYTGLLKCFFDLMPQAFLAGKVCVPLQTGGVPDHALATEYGLRPLFASLEGASIAGIYATDDEFVEGVPSADLRGRIDAVAREALRITNTAEVSP